MKPITDVIMVVARPINKPVKALMLAPMATTINVSAPATRQPISS